MDRDGGVIQKKRVVIYNRCSTEELTQVRALEVQVAESIEIAESKGWLVVRQFVEPKSGTESEHRYEYQKLFNSLASPEYDIVMVKSQDRLMRSDLDWNLFVKELLKYHKQLYFYIDNKFYHHESDYLLYGFTSKMNEGYSIELSKKIKNAHRRRQENFTGLNISRPMFGWDKIAPNLYVVNEDEAKAIRDAFEMVRAGTGFRTIANIMYDRGYRSKGTDGNRSLKGGMISATWWRKNCIYDPRMHGEVIMHKEEKNFFTKQREAVSKEEWIYYQNALPAIVSKEYQDETISMLQARAYKAPNADRTLVGKHLYSNKIVCKHCNCFFYRYKIKSGPDCELLNWKCAKQQQFGRQHCNNIIIEENTLNEMLDKEVVHKFEELFDGRSAIIDRALQYVKRALEDGSCKRELEKLKGELDRQVDKKEVLFDKLMDQIISDRDFKMFHQKLDKEIEDLEEKINILRVQEVQSEKIEERIMKIRERLKVDMAEKEVLFSEIRSLIDVIEVEYTGEITVRFHEEKLLEILELYNIAGCNDKVKAGGREIKFAYHRENKYDRERRVTNEKVVEILRTSPEMTIKECAAMLGKKYSYIYASFMQLKKEGRLPQKSS